MSKLRENNLGCEDIDIDIEADNNLESTNENSHLSENNIAFDASNCTFPADNIEDAVTINVLIVYTENARQYAAIHYTNIDKVIDQAMQRSNLAMVNSTTNITFNLVYKYRTTYTEENNENDLDNLQGANDGYMDEVHDLRKQYNADFVMLIPSVTYAGGQAFLLDTEAGFPTCAFGLSRVEQTSWSYTLVHEMGHILGCGHHWQQNVEPGPGLYSYSSGYRVQNAYSLWYSTIMTYAEGSYFADGNNAPNIPFFSSPDISYGGVYIGNATHANNVLGVKKTKHVSSRYSDYFNPALKCLSISTGTLTPSFSTDITEYTLSVPQSLASVTVSAIPTHPDAIITEGIGIKYLTFDSNTIKVTVKSNAPATNSYFITVTRSPDIIVSPVDTTICSGNSVTLTVSSVSAGSIFKWYDSQSGSSLVYTGANFTTPILISSTTYYVSQTLSGTESERIAVAVTINPLPNAPVANNITTNYDGNTHTASANVGNDEIIVWYTEATGGNITTEPSRSEVGTTTMYAAAKNITTNCESATRTAVTVTIFSTGKLSNAFTPYNQDGLNDTFGAGYDLIIFNRFGVALFKEKAINNNGWDGRYKGKLVEPGVYYYTARNSDGVEYRGSVTVVKK
jgi:gliding motility-associated-like protein